MSWAFWGRVGFKQILFILLLAFGIAVAAVAWTKPNATRLVVQNPHKAGNLLMQYVRPVDGRERIAAKKDGFDTLFLVLDACRPDKLSAYGFERETTPALESVVRGPDVALFRRHYVNGNWTKPSTASLFTGMFVHEHGVFMAWQPSKRNSSGHAFATQVLSDEIDTMAEMFAEGGYYTFGIVQGRHLDPEFGFAQGFDEYYTDADFSDDHRRMWATNALVRRIEGNYFGYVHLLGCHQPFPPSVRHEGYMDTYGFDYPEAERISKGVDFTTTEIKEPINTGKLKLSDDDARFLDLVYQARMRWMDEELVQPILTALQETGRYDNTLIVITADHGEGLYEHESYAHGGPHLWEEVVHVPLIVKFPKGMRPPALGPEVDELTSSIDLMPALAELLGRSSPGHQRGAPIFGGRFAGSTFTEGQSCAASLGDCIHSWSFLQGNYKLLEQSGETLLFDLQQDPREQRSIAEERPELVAQLRAAVDALRAGSSKAFLAREVETDVDEDTVRTLRSLGYIQ